MKRFLKNLIVPKGRNLRRIRGGVAKGMLMELDLSHQSQRYWGFDEREILPSLRRFIPICKSLIDVGANDGYYTMAFLRSSALRVVACEPGKEALGLLLKNARANGYGINARFSIEKTPIGRGEGFIPVPDLIQNLPRPVLLKVDIEGGELDLLLTAENYSFLKDLVWVIETHSKQLEGECIKWLQSHGYSTRVIANAPWRRLMPETRPLSHNRWLVAEPVRGRP
jgi:hypothetical protein